MNGETTDETLRLRGKEREAMMRMALAEDFLLKNKRDLDTRLMRVERGHNQISVVCGFIRRLNLQLYRTIPTDQMESLRRQLGELSYCIGVQRPQGNERNNDFGLWVSFDTINELISAIKDHCLMCNKDRQQERSCKLAKALDTIGNDLDERPGSGCKYRGVL